MKLRSRARWNEGHGRRRFVTERRVRPDRVVMPPPTFDDDLGFLQRVEGLAVEKLVSQLRVEALAIAILPRAAWLDISGPGAYSCNPLLQSLGDELRAIV